MGKNKRKYIDKSNLQGNKKHRSAGMRHPTPCMKGVMLTCNRGQERKCARESIALLSSIIDEMYPVEKTIEPTTSSVSDALASELAELLETGGVNNRVSEIEVGNASGLLLLEFVDNDPSIDPLRIVRAAFDIVKSNCASSTPHTNRMVPFQTSCFADMENIEATVVDFIPTMVKDLPKNQKFAVKIQTRKNKKIERMSVINKVAATIEDARSDFKVDLTSPDVVILVQIVHNVCVFAVFSDSIFSNYLDFNMRLMVETVVGKSVASAKESPTEPIETDSVDKLPQTSSESVAEEASNSIGHESTL